MMDKAETISTVQIRQLREMVHTLGRGLTQEEFMAIIAVFSKAVNRMAKEQGLD